MKISILTPDLSHNCLGRAYLLARILQRRYPVEIAGPVYGRGIWEPVAHASNVEYKAVPIRSRWKSIDLLELRKRLDGDVVYASKTLLPSFGVGALEKLSAGLPLALDIDDWEMGLILGDRSASADGRTFATRLSDITYFWTVAIAERTTWLADAITVSGTFLQAKFGGTIVWHARDTEAFDPAKFDTDSLRDQHGIGLDRTVVMFLGSPGPYKGVEDLIGAVRQIADPSVLLVLVGVDPTSSYGKGILAAGSAALGERFRTFGLQPFEKVPELLAMADAVVIPQRQSLATVGQVPAKVFDAMAMAKPIVATSVSDLPLILRDCGWIVDPGRPEQLASAIREVVRNRDAAEAIGRRAREKCVEEYSWDAMERVLIDIFQGFE